MTTTLTKRHKITFPCFNRRTLTRKPKHKQPRLSNKSAPQQFPDPDLPVHTIHYMFQEQNLTAARNLVSHVTNFPTLP